MYIVIIFPMEYDSLLGRSIECNILQGLIGNTICNAVNSSIIISNFETYLPSTDNPISLEIYGVINPNKIGDSQTNFFKIGIKKQTSDYFLDLNSQAGKFSFFTAPG